jgi:hypothetical protein
MDLSDRRHALHRPAPHISDRKNTGAAGLFFTEPGALSRLAKKWERESFQGFP